MKVEMNDGLNELRIKGIKFQWMEELMNEGLNE